MNCRYFKLIIVILALLLPLSVMAKLKVVTTTTDLAAITKAVAGDLVEVRSLIKGDQDPHYIEAKPSYARTLNQADLLIHVGLDLEIAWLPVLLTQSRNPRIQRGQIGDLDASTGITVLEIPQGRIDRSQGDIHPLGNPHYWLDPRNGLIIADTIVKRLIALDPDHKDSYEKAYKEFNRKLAKQIDIWKQLLQSVQKRPIVTNHRTFSYFANWAGLEVSAVIEPKPGIPPSPAHLIQVIKLMKRLHVPAVVIANFSDPKAGSEVARRSDSELLRVPVSVGGISDVRTYDQLIQYLIDTIVKKL